MVMVSAHNISVVAGALLGVAKYGVRFAYAHETAACVRIRRVVIRVVSFGQSVEGSWNKFS